MLIVKCKNQKENEMYNKSFVKDPSKLKEYAYGSIKAKQRTCPFTSH